MSLTKVSYSLIQNAPINVKDYGAVGDGRDDTAAIQAAATFASANELELFFPSGGYKISSTITFTPGKAFTVRGEGPNSTIISSTADTPTTTLFTLNATGGPPVVIENLSFYASTGLLGKGITVTNSNGVTIKNCWFVGLEIGINKPNTSSLLNVFDCTFEFDVTAIAFSGAIQCLVSGNTFYWNNFDYSFSGDFQSSVISQSTHIETINYCFYMDGVTGGIFFGFNFLQRFTQRLPVLFELVNNCRWNTISDVFVRNFGSKVVSLPTGSLSVNNTFNNFTALLNAQPAGAQPPPAGTGDAMFDFGTGCTGNIVNNFQCFGYNYGIIDRAGDCKFTTGGLFQTTIAAVLIQNSQNSAFRDITFINNAANWSVSGSCETAWVDGCTGDTAGLTANRIGSLRAGSYGRVFYRTAVPTTLAYLIGDVVFNTNPVVGQPKGWTCTVSGTPGTWVSQGNL